MALTKSDCDRFERREKTYKKFDGEGLYLEIKPNGSKLWRLKYRFAGKEKRLSFGPYPLITLKEAREKKRTAKLILGAHKDPALEIAKQKVQAQNAHDQNFKLIALEWFKIQEPIWSKGHAQNVMKRLEFDIFPFIGAFSIEEIRPPDVLKLLRNIEKRGALEVVKKSRQICGQIFQYGIQTGRCERNPCIHLRGALQKRKVQHYPSIDPREIPKFLKTLHFNEMRLYARTRRAIQLSMLTFLRPGELRRARWEDINLSMQEWIVLGQFMKNGMDHIVPLARQAVDILNAQKEETGHLNTPWVFPGQVHPHKPMSEATVGRALERMGYAGRMTAHGFRALARTTIREKLKYYPDVIEAQLAHKPSGPLGAAYDRAQFLDERKLMMQDWADYIDGFNN